MRSSPLGGLYEIRSYPLTASQPASKLKLPLTAPVQFAKELGSLKLGALAGLAAAIVRQWLEPGSPSVSWSDGGEALECMIVGMTVEGLLHYFLGWYVEPKLHQLRARREAQLQLEDLDQAEQEAALGQEECRRIRARITRRKIAGGFKPRRRRGPNKLHALEMPPSPMVFPSRTPRVPPAPPAAA